MIARFVAMTLGTLTFVLGCEYMHLDWQLMLALLNDVSQGRNVLPMVDLNIVNLPFSKI